VRRLIGKCMIATTAAAMVAIAWTQPAGAAFPGANGRLAFEDGIGRGIWTMNPDGTDRTKLNFFGADPKWSPDGSKIVFWNIGGTYVMNADGAGRTLVRENGRWPAWSPDGRKIVYTRARFDEQGLWIMNADGTDSTRITDGQDVEAAWSPDGSRIAFVRQFPGRFDLYVAQSDGSAPSLLRGGVAGDPDWSPDGQALAFYLFNGEIRVMREGRERATQASRGESPGWSPDGSKIVYAAAGVDGFADLFTMRADGTGPLNITNTQAFPIGTGREEFSPDWQPINRPPDCSRVVPAPTSLFPPNRQFRLVQLSGATDPDGDMIELSVTGVTQDEPVTGSGDPTAPDARLMPAGDQVDLRAERNPHGDGRVYRIAFEASDGRGGVCSGHVRVEVPRHQARPAVESPDRYDSLET